MVVTASLHSPAARARQLLLATILLAFVFTPLVGRLTGLAPVPVSEENRDLERMPELKPTRESVEKFPGAFEKYYNDHFGFRHILVRWHGMMKYFVLNESPSSAVVKGRDGWLYFRGPEVPARSQPLDDYRRSKPLTRREVTVWVHVKEQRRDWLAARGIRHLLVMIPNKSTIYPDYMPRHIPRLEGQTPFDQITEHLQRHSDLEYLDVRPVFQANRDRQRLYLKTDTHWNYLGSFLCYQAIAQALTQWYPMIRPLQESDFTFHVVTNVAGDLSRNMGLQKVLRDEYFLFQPHFAPLSTNLNQVSFERIREEAEYTETGDPSLPAAVVLGDSYIHGFMPFLAEHLRRGAFFLSYDRFPVGLIEQEKPDFVIEEVIERFMRRRDLNPSAVEQDVLRRQFEASTGTFFRAHAGNGFSGLDSAGDVALAAHEDGLTLTVTGSTPRLSLPNMPIRTPELPVLKVEFTSPRRTNFQLYWRTPEEGDSPWPYTRYSGHSVYPGTNVIYSTIFDPDALPPFELAPATSRGEYRILSVEARPRGKIPFAGQGLNAASAERGSQP